VIDEPHEAVVEDFDLLRHSCLLEGRARPMSDQERTYFPRVCTRVVGRRAGRLVVPLAPLSGH
jgi:hypothetical protein